MSNFRDSMKECLEKAKEQKHIEADAARLKAEYIESAYVHSRGYYTPEKFDELQKRHCYLFGKEDDSISRISNVYANFGEVTDGDMEYLYNHENKITKLEIEFEKNKERPHSNENEKKGFFDRLADSFLGGNDNVN